MNSSRHTLNTDSSAPRYVLITGASSGIGAALAKLYASAGMTLLLTARDGARLDAVAVECRSSGATVETAMIDVREKEKLAAWIMRMDDATPIDLVIANAGISTGSFTGTETLAAAEAVFDVNVTGVIHTIHPIIPRMVARRRGQIAIVASLAGICALPSAPAYSASKAAVRFYGDGLRAVLKPKGVDVSVICPGWIATPLTQGNHFPMPLIMPVARAAFIIQRGLMHRKARIVFPRALYLLLRLLAMLPYAASDFLLARLPEK